MASILVVEDSEDCVVLIERALGRHTLYLAGSIAEARTLTAGGAEFDLVLLDLNLPDGDGMTFCSEMSMAGTTQIPVIFLSGRQDVRDKVTAFSLGAEDYIEKPFDVLELQARVSARLRKLEKLRVRADVLERGDLRIDTIAMRAFHRGEDGESELDLSPTELRVLCQLVARPGNLITRDHLMTQVWADTIVGPRTIDTHVSKLRMKLRGTRARIQSVRGLGYRFQIASEARLQRSSESAA